MKRGLVGSGGEQCPNHPGIFDLRCQHRRWQNRGERRPVPLCGHSGAPRDLCEASANGGRYRCGGFEATRAGRAVEDGD